MFRATPGVHRTPRKRAEEINRPTAFDGPSEATYSVEGGHPIGVGMPARDAYEGVDLEVNVAASRSKSIKDPFKLGGR